MTLRRTDIISAAIALADERGGDALTMKAVAERLGPYSAMALYRHVRGKDELIDGMLDAATALVPIPDAPGPDWRADLLAIARDTRQMIKDHPWYAQLVHTRPPTGPHALRRTEFLLRVLTGRGSSVPEAMTFAALIDRHIFGSALQEVQEARFNESSGIRNDDDLVAAIRGVQDRAKDLPLLAGWLAHPAAVTGDEQFELGLRFLLDGIARS